MGGADRPTTGMGGRLVRLVRGGKTRLGETPLRQSLRLDAIDAAPALRGCEVPVIPRVIKRGVKCPAYPRKDSH